MMFLMKIIKREIVVCFMLLIALFGGACGSVTPVPTIAVTETIPPIITAIGPTSTTVPIATDTPTLTSTPPVPSPPDGLRMVYRTSQGLYIKDGNNPPRQLTQHAEDINPRISDDGMKIIFERWATPLTLYSINAGGGDELALVTRDKLAALNLGYDAFIAKPDDITFVPGTHLLLFETANFEIPNSDLLSVDTDTGEIKSILPIRQAADYYISPDGTKIAINVLGEPSHIDLLSIDGKMLQRNIATYTLSKPIPLLPEVHWAQDSNSLTIVLPYPTIYDTSGGAPNYTLWRYTLGENKSMQVPLDPMPKDLVEVSPNSNWVTYRDDSYRLYVGDIRNGSSQLYETHTVPLLYAWSPDSVHFVYGIRKIFLGTVNTLPVSFGNGDFIDWLDASRFLYYDYVDKTIVIGNVDGEKRIILTGAHEGFQESATFTFIFIKQEKSN